MVWSDTPHSSHTRSGQKCSFWLAHSHTRSAFASARSAGLGSADRMLITGCLQDGHDLQPRWNAVCRQPLQNECMQSLSVTASSMTSRQIGHLRPTQDRC